MGLSRYFASQCQLILIEGLFPFNCLHRAQLIDLHKTELTKWVMIPSPIPS